MKIAAQKLNNNGVVLSKVSIKKSFEKYIKKYNTAVYRLYIMGYIENPYDFDDIEFESMLHKDFSSEVMKCFKSEIDASLDFSLLRLDYVINMLDISDDFKQLLLLYRDIVESKEAIESLNYIKNNTKFQKRSDSVTISPRWVVTSRVMQTSSLKLDNPLKIGALEDIDSMSIKKVSVNEAIVKQLAKELGVSVTEDKSLFFSGKPFSADCEYLDLLITGRVKGDTECADKLFDKIVTYYTDFYSTNDSTHSQLPYRETIFIKALDSCIEIIKKFREKNPNAKEVFITNDAVYFSVPNEYEAGKEKIDVGFCVFDHINQIELSKINALRGYSGEFISADDVKRLGYTAKCDSVKLLVDSKKMIERDYYPISFVTKTNSKGVELPLTPKLGYSIDLINSDVSTVCLGLGISSLNNLYQNTYNRLDSILANNSDNMKYTVSTLFTGLVCTECDYILSDNDYSNQLYLDSRFSNMSDSDKFIAMKEAEKLYNNCGL